MNWIERWQQSSSRERTLVLGGGVILMATALYVGVIEPFYQDYRQTQARVQQLREDWVWMQQAAQTLRASNAVAAPQALPRPLWVLIDELATQHRLNTALRRIEPQGDGLLVQFERVNFNALVDWLVALTEFPAIELTTVRLTPTAIGSGQVDARIILGGPAS